jgi:catechol 2,3-dioxygenase-like lactoylglutathione lyase family enzyme
MPITLDHLAIFAPRLDQGVEWVREVLGVVPSAGGQHPHMGTHNRLLRLGDDMFLEIIARDPGAERPTKHQTWFELGDDAATSANWGQGLRLRGMIARTSGLPHAISRAPDELGAPMRLTRGEREWMFGVRADGKLPRGGTLPHLMDPGAHGPGGPRMPDQGCRLVHLVLETPDDESVIKSLYGALAFERAPELRPGSRTRLIAAIETRNGVRILT